MKGAKPPRPTASSGGVAAFIAGTKHPMKTGIAALRDIILGADKTITGHIKWNAPSFCIDGDDRVTLNLSRPDRIAIIFHRGAKAKDTKGFVFNDPSGLLEWKAVDRGSIEFKSIEDIAAHAAALRKVVRAWVRATA